MKDIELVPLAKEDIELVREWRNSPEVSQYMFTDDLISKQQQEKWFKKITQEETTKYWIIKYDNTKVGVANLSDIDRRNSKCIWGFYLGDSSLRGQGIGAKVEYNVLKYVFEEINLNKLCGLALSFNEKVVQMHEKFGFRREGYLRSHIKRNNKFYDVVVIGLLSSEWDQVKEQLHKRIYGT